MATKSNTALHIHNWAVKLSDFENIETLKNFFKVISTDVARDVPYVTAAEAYNYSIFGVLYHPEY